MLRFQHTMFTMKPKRIRFIITSLETGGAELHLLRIMPALIQDGYKVRIFVTNAEKPESLTQAFVGTGAQVVFLTPTKKPWHLFNGLLIAAGRLCKDMLKHRQDIIHCFLPKAYIMGMLCAMITHNKAPILMSRRSLNHYQTKYPLIKYLEKHLHRRTTQILANSQAVLTQLAQEEAVPSDKLGLIYNGVEPPPSQDIPALKKQYQLAQSSLILMKVANLAPHKGHADLLNALALIQSDLPDNWHLVCVGFNRKGYLTQLKALAQSLGIHTHIIWLTHITQASPLYAMADIVILSSHGEGFANVILEAMASGKPVIATDVGGNKEAVVNGDTGLITPPHNPQALAEGIIALAQNPDQCKKMGQLGFERWQNSFSLQHCTAQYLQLYQTIIGMQ